MTEDILIFCLPINSIKFDDQNTNRAAVLLSVS